jgi:hypothetical protein
LRLGNLGFACLLCAALCAAQAAPSQSAPAPAQPPTETKTQRETEIEKTKTEREKEIEKKEQSQRVLGVLPQFAVTSRQNAPPLTRGEKFHLFAKSAFDPVEFGLVGLQAGLSQAEDEFPGYGQGVQGYAKRYGAAFADQVSSGFWSNFFWSTALKEDPRYFRLGEGTFKRRFVYALEQEIICHTDKGGRSFSWENTLGALSSGGLSNVYYPQSDRGFELTMSRAGIAILYGSAGGLFDEFWPDIHQKLLHKRHKNDEAAPKIP